ncbi:helix-turn-helix domain-containing protein [Actinoplanes sp. NPDC049668]|uniref:helix-turn-helix domain-containing protein n=1 Tax=unclassified Actinoplanes TaxID=2626549 RepID=UPI0033A0D543
MIDRDETFADALRRLMRAQELTVRGLESRVPMSRAKLGRLVNGTATVTEEDAAILDDALHAGLTLVIAGRRDREAAAAKVLLGPNRYTDVVVLLGGGTGGQEVSDVDRRGFMRAGLGAATLLLELGRLGLGEAMSSRGDLSAADWEATVTEHGFGYMTTPPHELLKTLMVDVVAIQYAVNGEPEDSVRAKDLQRCAALLAALTAMTVANLGDLREGQRWWRTARDLADRSTDPVTRAWVRGREIVRAMYEQRPIGSILHLTETYEGELAGAPRDAMPEFLGGKAQALALAGRTSEANAVLPVFLTVCADLPARVTSIGASVFGWSEVRQNFTESFVHSFNGNFAQAAAAQDAAVALYPSEYVRGPAQIELQRALCLARMGDSAGAASHALGALSQLPSADHIRPIVDLAHRVDRSIEPADSGLTEVVAYRDYLATTRQIEAA